MCASDCVKQVSVFVCVCVCIYIGIYMLYIPIYTYIYIYILDLVEVSDHCRASPPNTLHPLEGLPMEEHMGKDCRKSAQEITRDLKRSVRNP